MTGDGRRRKRDKERSAVDGARFPEARERLFLIIIERARASERS